MDGLRNALGATAAYALAHPFKLLLLALLVPVGLAADTFGQFAVVAAGAAFVAMFDA